MSPDTAGGVTGEIGGVADGEGGGAERIGVCGAAARGWGVGAGGFTPGLAQAAARARRTNERWRTRMTGSLTSACVPLNRNRSPKD